MFDVDTWKSMNDALVNEKAHKARGSKQELLMAHEEDLEIHKEVKTCK